MLKMSFRTQDEAVGVVSDWVIQHFRQFPRALLPSRYLEYLTFRLPNLLI